LQSDYYIAGAAGCAAVAMILFCQKRCRMLTLLLFLLHPEIKHIRACIMAAIVHIKMAAGAII
jgi:hypothetical protein